MDKERKVLLETRLRNIKRKHSKLMQYPEMLDECIELDKEIKSIEQQLSAMT
jgi:hypothetical protein